MISNLYRSKLMFLLSLILAPSITIAVADTKSPKDEKKLSAPLQFESFAQMASHFNKTQQWGAQNLIVEVIETKIKIGPNELHDIAITDRTKCGMGGCPYLLFSRTFIGADKIQLRQISKEFFGEFKLLPQMSHDRYHLSVTSHLGADIKSEFILKFNGTSYD